jgi:hypothetical protein
MRWAFRSPEAAKRRCAACGGMFNRIYRSPSAIPHLTHSRVLGYLGVVGGGGVRIRAVVIVIRGKVPLAIQNVVLIPGMLGGHR